MEPLAFAVFTINQKNVGNLSHSALPGAPVLVPVEKAPRLTRSRATLASALHWLADVTAPTIECPSATYAVR